MRQVIFSKCLLTIQNKSSIFGIVLQKADTKAKLINTVVKARTGCYSKNTPTKLRRKESSYEKNSNFSLV
jgi:hypothetical protein